MFGSFSLLSCIESYICLVQMYSHISFYAWCDLSYRVRFLGFRLLDEHVDMTGKNLVSIYPHKNIGINSRAFFFAFPESKV